MAHATREHLSERHVKAAVARWGPTRHINLADLSDDKRRIVLAFVELAREADAKKSAPAVDKPEALAEVRRAAVDPAA